MGAEILADGGTAVDAVVAMALASCVAETVMSGLLAGCHAIVFDGTSVMNLDGFAAVPSASAELAELPIAFGDELVVYAIGAPSCAVPGLPAALRRPAADLVRVDPDRLLQGDRALEEPLLCGRLARCEIFHVAIPTQAPPLSPLSVG